MTKIEFPFYSANVKDPVPRGNWSLDSMIYLISHPDSCEYANYRAIQTQTDPAIRSSLKEQVFYTTPAVMTDGKGRGYKNITAFTGYLVLDFDKMPDASTFRDELFESCPEIIAAWLSVSAKGVRAVVKIPVVETVDQYKALFYGYYEQLKRMDKHHYFDLAPQNPVLPLFMSMDYKIHSRPETQTLLWTETADHPHKTTARAPRPTEFSSVDRVISDAALDRYEMWSITDVTKAISSITDNGHMQVRASAFRFGGYVGSHYVNYWKAENLLIELIRSNEYLSKGTEGYIKTAIQMLLKGIEKPLRYD